MTKEKAIKIINSVMTTYGEDAIDYEEIFEARDIAIRSLEAWKKVKEEIKVIRDRECLENDNFDEYSEGRYDVACECLRIIYKHLSEVSE